MAKNEAMPFDWAAWDGDDGVQSLDVRTERGVWWELLGLMWKSKRRGYLTLNGIAYPHEALATKLRIPPDNLEAILEKIINYQICSVEEDTGILYSRKIVADEARRQGGVEGGKRGGNPNLTDGYHRPGFVFSFQRESDGLFQIRLSGNPARRLSKIREDNKSDKFLGMQSLEVPNMQIFKDALIEFYSPFDVGGWLKLPDEYALDPLSPLKGYLNGGANGEVNGPLNLNLNFKLKEEDKSSSSGEKEKSRSGGKAVPLPDDFEITGKMRAWAKDNVPGFDIDAATNGQFRRYWTGPDAKNKGLRKDWTRTWYNSMEMYYKTEVKHGRLREPGEIKHKGRKIGEFSN